MRGKEEILNECRGYGTITNDTRFLLEVLIDIRDELVNMNKLMRSK